MGTEARGKRKIAELGRAGDDPQLETTWPRLGIVWASSAWAIGDGTALRGKTGVGKWSLGKEAGNTLCDWGSSRGETGNESSIPRRTGARWTRGEKMSGLKGKEESSAESSRRSRAGVGVGVGAIIPIGIILLLQSFLLA